MKSTIKWIYSIIILSSISACNKTEFLNKKPSTDILTPKSLTDFQNLLDNTTVMNFTGALNQVGADDVDVSDVNYPTATATERNGYIWAKDLYAGDVGITDWNGAYKQVFYSNNVLDGLTKSDSIGTPQGQYLKGWALFTRAYAFYDLTRTFCKAYNSSTSQTDLGIPLKLKSGIDNIEPRANLQQTFDQILGDLALASSLLPASRPSANLNRPSKIAGYALLARIYLDMGNYGQAETNADLALGLYNRLIDYNTVSTTSSTPFSATNDELIYNTSQAPYCGYFTGTNSVSLGKVPLNIINSYSSNDIRLTTYYGKLTDGTYYRKRGYFGSGSYSFTGLATDELYLIKAECLARKNQPTQAVDELNLLLSKRYKTGTFSPLVAGTADATLALVLMERIKELNRRGLRWVDLKRLNQAGANITLTRVLKGLTYSLGPNDDRWVMPIPTDEIALSGIKQNPGR